MRSGACRTQVGGAPVPRSQFKGHLRVCRVSPGKEQGSGRCPQTSGPFCQSGAWRGGATSWRALVQPGRAVKGGPARDWHLKA